MTKHNEVHALNYSVDAIEDLKRFSSSLRASAPRASHATKQIIRLLRDSVKFILPNECSLIEPEKFNQNHIDLMHLPYPCVAFETPWNTNDYIDEIGGVKNYPATKRISLCWDSNAIEEPIPGLYEILDQHEDGGVFVVPIYWGPETKEWTLGFGGSFLPYKNELKKRGDEQAAASLIAQKALIDAGLGKSNGNSIEAEPFGFLPELYEYSIVNIGYDKVFSQIIIDSQDDVFTMIQACSVLNCSNVETDEIKPPVPLSKKRKAQGKPPLFSYKILQISEGTKSSKPNSMRGECKTSPRTHLRRGHLRRLGDRLVWVKPALVNPNVKTGIVDKDYALKTIG